MCLFLWQCHAVFITIVVGLKMRIDTSCSSFISQDCFSYPEVLVFPYKVKAALSRSVKNCVGILTEIPLNVWNALSRETIFTILLILMHKHGPFSIFWYFLQFLSSVALSFYQASLSLIWFRVTPKIFILFESIMKRGVSLISFSVHLSCV